MYTSVPPKSRECQQFIFACFSRKISTYAHVEISRMYARFRDMTFEVAKPIDRDIPARILVHTLGKQWPVHISGIGNFGIVPVARFFFFFIHCTNVYSIFACVMSEWVHIYTINNSMINTSSPVTSFNSGDIIMRAVMIIIMRGRMQQLQCETQV